MSSWRKSSVPSIVYVTGSTAEPSLEMDLSLSLQNTCSPVQTSTNKSWAVLKAEEEAEAEGASTDEQGSCNTSNTNFPHSEGPFNVLYLCTTCDFSTNKFDCLSYHNEAQHPGKSLVSFKQIKLDSCSILERPTKKEFVPQEPCNVNDLQLILTDSLAAENDEKVPAGKILDNRPEVDNQPDNMKDEIRAVSVNGTIIIAEPMLHITPLLQLPHDLSSTPRIAVPLYAEKYNPILDSNLTLIASFNRFPYPTHAELSWLTAASKHPEEQIKVWFTTQRLKQGISWSPEEVEEARKKMFNGSIPPAHQICTIGPIKPNQPFAQKTNCYVTEQTSSASNGSSTTCQSVSVTAANQTLIFKRSLVTPLLASETKCAVVPQTGDHKESLCMPPPPAPSAEKLIIASSPLFLKSKKSSSLIVSDFKRYIIAPFVSPNRKMPLVPSKQKIPVGRSAALPKKRLPLTPIISSNLKRSIVLQQMNTHFSGNFLNSKNKKLSYSGDDVCMSSTSTVMGPHVTLATPCVPLAAPPLSSAPTTVSECQTLKASTPLMFTYCQNGIEILNDQSTNTQNEFKPWLRECPDPTQFPLLERVKGKSSAQTSLLEESFQRDSFPSFNEVDHLMITTRLSREEIESWFLERRALRDDLEQALLNSMGSKKGSVQSQQAQKRAGTFHFTPVDSKSRSLLKNVFVHTGWPSPAEFRNLEMQKGFVQTDFVHWFRNRQLTQQIDMLGQASGYTGEHLLTQVTSIPSDPEIKDWFSSMLGQRRPDVDSNAGAVYGGRKRHGGWRCDAVGAESCDLISDTD